MMRFLLWTVSLLALAFVFACSSPEEDGDTSGSTETGSSTDGADEASMTEPAGTGDGDEDEDHDGEEHAGSSIPIDDVMAAAGQEVFETVGCLNCHSVGDVGTAEVGPNLEGVGEEHGDVQWLLELFEDPSSKGKTAMPSFSDLSEEDSRSLAEYVRSL